MAASPGPLPILLPDDSRLSLESIHQQDGVIGLSLPQSGLRRRAQFVASIPATTTANIPELCGTSRGKAPWLGFRCERAGFIADREIVAAGFSRSDFQLSSDRMADRPTAIETYWS